MIGYCYLVGDVIHRGHILYLKNCKALCDKLIVGVLTNEAVMEKKPKPILSFDERMTIIESIRYVDLVVPQDKYNPTNNCSLLHPDILFESGNHEEWGSNYDRQVIGIPYFPEQSSSKIKEKVKSGNSG